MIRFRCICPRHQNTMPPCSVEQHNPRPDFLALLSADTAAHTVFEPSTKIRHRLLSSLSPRTSSELLEPQHPATRSTFISRLATS